MVSAEADVAPSPARLARARRAGLRPRAPRLAAGLALLALAAGLEASDGALAGVSAQLTTVLRTPSPDGVLAIFAGGLGLVAVGLAVALACSWIASAVTAEIGAVVPEPALADVHPRPAALALLTVALAAAAAIGLALDGVVAGSARAADAGDAALAILWEGWAARLALVLASAFVAVSAIDLWLDRRAIFRALHLTVQQARDEQRDRGGRRR